MEVILAVILQRIAVTYGYQTVQLAQQQAMAIKKMRVVVTQIMLQKIFQHVVNIHQLVHIHVKTIHVVNIIMILTPDMILPRVAKFQNLKKNIRVMEIGAKIALI